jgi:small subunit ribosomal protein S7
MPRKGPAEKRKLSPDPVYRSLLVTQIVNKVMLHGKRTVAEKIMYDAMKIVEEKTGAEPLATVEARGRQHQAPARGEEPPRRWRDVPGADGGPPSACQHARHPVARRLQSRPAGEDDVRVPRRRDHGCCERPRAAIKRRDDMQKMAESNRAFAHYRW